MTTRCMVVSAVNLIEGGTLTILREFVKAASEILPQQWKIVVLVHNRNLLAEDRPVYLELPDAKRGWLRRMYMEWTGFRAYVGDTRPDLWVSLSDITPTVSAARQVVYCHNPMPFFRMQIRDMWLQPVLIAFRFGYQLVYRVNLQRNYAVVVQQSWLRDEFRRWVRPGTKIIVAHPTVSAPVVPMRASTSFNGGPVRFLYPALPRVFKNVELICRAVSHLEKSVAWQGEIVLTIEQSENRYSRWLWRTFGHLKSLRFAGRQNLQQMRDLYVTSHCLIFPSRLETWGLPITEAKQVGLPMLLADCPYAHEALGSYDRAAFFDAADHLELASKMLQFQGGTLRFAEAREVKPAKPYAQDWRELLDLLTEGLA